VFVSDRLFESFIVGQIWPEFLSNFGPNPNLAVKFGIGVGEGRQEAHASSPGLEVIWTKLEHIRANLKIFWQTWNWKMKTFFRDHTYSMRKRGKFPEDFFWRTHYTFEKFCFGHSGRFFPPPQTVLFSYGYEVPAGRLTTLIRPQKLKVSLASVTLGKSSFWKLKGIETKCVNYCRLFSRS